MRHFKLFLGILILFFSLSSFTKTAYASNSWGGYHWARTTNSFTLNLGDNLSSAWKPFLRQASTDWSLSSILDTSVVSGRAKGNCQPTSGRVEVCNKNYGNNGWLGIAQVWVSGLHITQATTKMNDTYFNTSTYNTPSWKQFVICQEVGHTFGLDHQDIIFNNINLGTCMDYTNDPDGTLYNQLSNLHPNQHDYDELSSIYAHLDSITTVRQSTGQISRQTALEIGDNPGEWGKQVKKEGRLAKYERDFGGGNKLFTFVILAE